MKMIECPSELIPGPVPIRIEIPDDWTVGPAPLVSFVAVAPQGEAAVTTNAVVMLRRVGDSLDLEEMREMIASDIGAIDGAVLTEEDMLDLSGVPALFRMTELNLPENGGSFKVMQVAALAKLRGGVADVVTLTITLAAAATDEHVELCRAIVRSLRVGNAA